MVRMFKPIALVGTVLLLSSAPAFAEAFTLNPLGVNLNPLGIPVPAELDPYHFITPTPPPPAPMMVMHHRHHHHKMMMMHHKMMMKHHKMMMMKKKM